MNRQSPLSVSTAWCGDDGGNPSFNREQFACWRSTSAMMVRPPLTAAHLLSSAVNSSGTRPGAWKLARCPSRWLP